MRDLYSMAPDEVLRELFAERRRRENPPSIQGVDPDQPKERKPSSGRYEELILLTTGCNPLGLTILYEASALYQLATWKCPIGDCRQVTAHEHREVKGIDGHPLLSGGVPMTEPVALPVPPTRISMRWGVDSKTMKRMHRDVLDQVAENMAERRARTGLEQRHVEIAELQALARRVLQ